MEYTIPSLSERLSRFMYRVYALMGIALTITGVTAFYVASTPALYKQIMGHSGIVFGLFLVQILLVLMLGFFLPKLSLPVATGAFILYAISVGFTLSVIFLVYTQTSIASTFFITAGMFSSMALYGYYTKSDLTKIGSIAFMGLIGLIIASLVNIFLKSSMLEYIVSIAGVLVFTLLTAYDVQRIKTMAARMLAEGMLVGKVAVFGSLNLYLDFLNMFLYILQFTGRRKQ